MLNDPVTREVKEYYEITVGASYADLENTLAEDTRMPSEYYDIDYYLLNTFYWSSKSNQIIWEITKDVVKKPVETLLDFGCGSGLYTERLKSLCNSYKGTDVSYTDLTLAKTIHADKGNVEFISLDAFTSSKETFDIIFCSETLDHIDNPQETLMCLKKRLNDKGLLVLTTTTLYHYIFRILFNYIWGDLSRNEYKRAFYRVYIYIKALVFFSSRRELLTCGLDRDDHKNAITHRQLKSLAKSAGLKITYYEYFNCKDIFPHKAFQPINDFLKKVLRRSYTYGPNIVVCLTPA